MRHTFILFFLSVTFVRAQSIIDWSESSHLQFSDFQSPATQISGGNIYSLQSGSRMDFSFAMTNAEFMFTKNFNSKVNCRFKRGAASLVSPDSVSAIDLLNFSRFDFDLNELYARKFRKKLYEEKAAFSNISFFRPIYDEIEREFSESRTMAGKQTELGRNKEKLIELHQEVSKEIQTLSDFCKTCKPPKKKK